MTKSITAAALAVMVINVVVKLLGFAREMIIARVFGATPVVDAYVTAYTIPYFLQAVLGAAIVTVTVPIITKYLVNGNRQESYLVTNYVVNFTALLMAVFCVAGIALAPLLVKITTPWLPDVTAKMAADMMRIMLPTAFFMGIGMVLAGFLNANHRFVVPAFAPGLCSIIIIASLLIVGADGGIYSLAVATLIGFLAYFILLIPASYRMGYRYQPRLSLHHPDVNRALASLIPIMLGTSVNQIYYLINRFFASGLEAGVISILNYASKLMNVPLSVFIAAIAVAIYPSLTEYALKDDRQHLNDSLRKGVGITMLISIPAAVGLIALRLPLVELVYEGGAFTHQDTLLTSAALLWYSIGLFGLSIVMVLNRVYYAFSDIRTPVYAALLAVAVNIVVSVATIGWLGENGLALANSVAAIAHMCFFFFLLKRYLPMLRFRPYLAPFFKITFAACLMGVLVWSLQKGMIAVGLDSALLLVILGLFVGIASFIFLARLLHVAELHDITNVIKAKLGHKT